MAQGASPTHSLVGAVVGGEYTVVRALDAGGMGAVFEARDSLGQAVALKVPLLTHEPKILARFRDEAAALAQLRHPNIVRVLRSGEHNGVPFMAMEFLHGESLYARLERFGTLDVTQAIDFALPVISAFALVHSKGILHRDLKPENIFLARDDQGVERPVLIDFGVARLRDSQRHARTTVNGAPTTFAFCGPERLEQKDRELTTAFDQFTLGAVIFSMLSGTWFEPMGFAMAMIAGQFSAAPLREHGVPIDPREKRIGEALHGAVVRIVEASLLDGRYVGVDRLTLTPRIEQAGHVVPLGSISSGNAYLIHRMLGLLGRMYSVAMLRGSIPREDAVAPFRDVPGFLLIDEVENHLHPRWQKSVIPALRTLFPNVQVIATTHAPLVLSSVPGARVYQCRYDRDRRVCVARDETSAFASRSVEEILLSDAFDETLPWSDAVSALFHARMRAIEASDDDARRRAEEALVRINPEHFAYLRAAWEAGVVAGQHP